MGRSDMTTLLFLPHVRGDAPSPDGPVIAVAPAEAVTLHWAEVPARTPAQAVAAARLLVAEASAAPIGELHVAVGDEGDADRPIAVVSAAVMTEWLESLMADGIDPVAIVPAPLLLPRPEEDYVTAEVGAEWLVRGRSVAFAHDPLITPLVTGDAEPRALTPDEMAAAHESVLAQVPLDLRQGPFARRRRRAIDWPLVRRLGVLAASILLATLAIDVVRIAKYSFGADALDARADALGRTGLARGETVTDVDRQLSERLSGVRGPGVGFSAAVAAVYAAVRAVPGTELTGLDFSPNGDLRLSVAAARESLPTDLKRALEAAGFAVTAGVFQSANGRVTGEMTVRRP
jgi:general secretion pathway protein L